MSHTQGAEAHGRKTSAQGLHPKSRAQTLRDLTALPILTDGRISTTKEGLWVYRSGRQGWDTWSGGLGLFRGGMTSKDKAGGEESSPMLPGSAQHRQRSQQGLRRGQRCGQETVLSFMGCKTLTSGGHAPSTQGVPEPEPKSPLTHLPKHRRPALALGLAPTLGPWLGLGQWRGHWPERRACRGGEGTQGEGRC